MFEGYQFNTEKANSRYEYISERPLKIEIIENGRKQCKCGAKLVPLAYVYDDGHTRSMNLIGRKCSYCGQNYFTEKTVSKCELAFEVETSEQRIGSSAVVAMQKTSNTKRDYPTHVFLKKGILHMESMVCLEQIKTIDKQRLEQYVTTLDEKIMQQIDRSILVSLGIKEFEKFEGEFEISHYE
jgi:mRNA-degrading endonuclease toxin of MazEF toxin-antitoxin module